MLAALLSSRERIDCWQTNRIENLRRHAIANTDFYRRLGDIPFKAFPVVEKSMMMAQFEAFNMLGLTASDGWQQFEIGQSPPGYDLGCSTGTSGNRGLYLVSDRERFVWLGTIVAKALPDVLRRRHRVAVILPRASRLYDAANESRLLKLRFFELTAGLHVIAEQISGFQPTVVVGPPKALRWMAQNGIAITPERMFSGGEVLDSVDRTVIEHSFNLKLGQIYMATEGLFGVSCEYGVVHLAEDAVHFEFEPVGDRLVSPTVTDFTRRTQVMACYRMNDLLRLADKPCRCGSAFLAVEEIVGRRDDCFELPPRGTVGKAITVTPDIPRNAVLDADRRIDDFRVLQTGSNAVDLVLNSNLPDDAANAAKQSLTSALLKLGAAPDITLRREPLPVDITAKLRRVEQRWRPHAGGELPN